jgi:DNA-binding NtrC family response regulator
MNKKQGLNWKLIGVSEHIKYLKNEIEYVAKKTKALDMAVLISGPSGTGKELIAKAISGRAGLNMVTINCGAIPQELFESELFGYKKGAFTGAFADKKGLVEEAEKGILFLDEIGDLALHHQAKFLRFLQDKTFYRVGDKNQRSVKNIKIIAATNKDLEEAVSERKIRRDLFYRINHRIIKTMPLKNRREDIICLVNHFVDETKVKIDPKVKLLLYSYDFPGNVRELESLIYSSDDFEYIKNALREVVASNIGIAVEFISRFESLNDFDNKTSTGDMLDMQHEWRRDLRREKGGEEELLWHEKLLRNTDADEFFRATFFAEEKDCSKMVEAYEIMTLRLCPGLSRDDIAKILHVRPEKLSPEGFKQRFGFDMPINKDIWNYTGPVKLYPSFPNYLSCSLRSKEPNP